MIKLTLNPNIQAEQHTFSKERLVIGSGTTALNDFVIEENSLEGPCVEIHEESGLFIVTNLIDSNKILINGQIFSSTTLSMGDVVSIINTDIRFDELVPIEGRPTESISSVKASISEDFDDEDIDIDALLNIDALSSLFDEPVIAFQEASQRSKEDSFDLDKLVEEAAAANIEEILPESEEAIRQRQEIEKYGVAFADENEDLEQTKGIAALQKIMPSGKTTGEASQSDNPKNNESFLNDDDEGRLIFGGVDFNDNSQGICLDIEESQTPATHKSPKYGVIKQVIQITSIVCFAVLLVGIMGFFYFQRDRRELEVRAAQGLADITMAFLQTRLNTPSDKSFIISPQILANQLSTLLSPQYRKISPIDAHGNLIPPDYIYQIHIDKDSPRFLILVQPKPSLLNYLYNQKTFVIEHENLQIRHIADLSSWANLLDDITSLKSVNASDIQKLIFQANLVHLSSLDAGKSENGFTPPSSLRDFNPGAENYVYNAPRYYNFGKSVLDIALDTASQNPDRSSNHFKDFLKTLHKLEDAYFPFNDLVLYSTATLDQTLEAYYLLESTTPLTQFLIAHLELNPENQLFQSAEVLSPDDLVAFVNKHKLPSPQDLAKELTSKPISPLKNTFDKFNQLSSGENSKETIQRIVQEKRTITSRVKKLAQQHQADLKEVTNAIRILSPKDAIQREQLQKKYDTIDEVHKQMIQGELDLLYAEYQDNAPQETLSHFYRVIQENNLTNFMSKQLKASLESNIVPLVVLTQQTLTQQIQRTLNLEQLSVILDETNTLLNAANVSNPVELTGLKEIVRIQALNKLHSFLLAPDTSNVPISYHIKNIDILNNIFKNANITERDEQSFFIREFDKLAAQYALSPSKEEFSKLRQLNQDLLSLSEIDQELSPEDRELLQERYSSELLKVREKEKAAQDTEEKISQVPLEYMYTTDSNRRKLYLGRLGQQMLIQANTLPPSPLRNEQLYEAIDLLEKASEGNRLLWGNVLQARNLLTEDPLQRIKTILKSDLGFSTEYNPAYIKLRSLLKSYIEGKQLLSQITNNEQYNAQLEYFISTQGNTLSEIQSIASYIINQSRELNSSMNDYISLLKRFLSDYEKARNQGFFISDPAYQATMLSRLKRQLALAESLQPQVATITKKFVATSNAYLAIATQERVSFVNKVPVNQENISRLLNQWNDNTFPSLANEGVMGSFRELFSTQINPMP